MQEVNAEVNNKIMSIYTSLNGQKLLTNLWIKQKNENTVTVKFSFARTLA